MMDVTTLSISVGLIVSLLFSEAFGLSTGGMIVPGYFALYLNKPANIVLTLLAAFATLAAVRLLSKFAIVYGRRRIVMMILTGFLLGSVLRCATAAMFEIPWLSATGGSSCMCVIGFIIPGLIALWIDRQGCVETLAPLMTSSVIVRLALILVGVEMLA